MLGQVDIWTYALAPESELDLYYPDYQFTTISILASGGFLTINGSKSVGTIGQSPITLTDGQSITINAGNNETNVINDIVINTNVGCTAYIVAR
jgi:hypothetical protein